MKSGGPRRRPINPHVLWSLTKSFTSTAVGMAVAEGKLSVDDPVLKFFADEAPPNPSIHLQAMRVSDLLTMSTGHDRELKWLESEDWIKDFLASRRPASARNALHVQHPGESCVVGDRPKSHRPDGQAVPAATLI